MATCLMLAGLATGPFAAAEGLPGAPDGLEVAGVRFEGRQQLGDRTLVLNGVGVRSKMYIRIYAMGLYLAHPAGEAQAVVAPGEAHRIVLVLLRDVDAQRMSDGLAHAMLEDLPAPLVAALRERVVQLAQDLRDHGDVKRGDVMWLDYQPTVGTRVSIGGTQVGPVIPGEDFNAAMLGMWLGDHAPDDKLRAALLGRARP
ncbi:MAG: hypothetical protein RI907_3009 [Pseudomonadota bacterium]|jgi:hypothetical protein